MVSDKPRIAAEQAGVPLPRGYQEVRGLNIVSLPPWHLLTDDEFDYLFAGLNERHPHRRVIPFARRADNDDVACFVVSDPDQPAGQVIVVHDFASPGYEVVKRLRNCWEWLRYAVGEMIERHEAVPDS